MHTHSALRKRDFTDLTIICILQGRGGSCALVLRVHEYFENDRKVFGLNLGERRKVILYKTPSH